MIQEDLLEGDSVAFFGTTYYNSGTYTHSTTTPEGCDSTTVLQLTIHPLVDTVFNVCDNDLPVIWHNKWSGNTEYFYTSGLYRNDTVKNGRRYYYGIQVNVAFQKFDTIRHAMCEGSSYEFAGQVLWEEGIYRDTLVHQPTGCDSIVTLILTVNKPYRNTIRETILEGNYYIFFGDTIRDTRSVTHTTRTPQGCDSTTILNLTVHPLIDTTVTICSYDLPYVWTNKWNGQTETFYKEGTYRNDTTLNGEHYFFGLRLVVNKPAFDTIRHAMCEGDFYTFQGQPVYEAGIYRDTLNGANGCDSIVTHIITVNKSHYSYIERDIVEGQTVDVFGHTFNSDSILTIKTTTLQGCDSIIEIKVNMHPKVDTTVTICKGDLPYMWKNKWDTTVVTPLYSAGFYRNDTVKVNGKQMFYGIQLIVRQTSDTTIYREICEGDSYTFNGRELTIGGEYRDTIINKIGCDSVIKLNLNVLKKYHMVIERKIFEGDSVKVGDTFYREAGIYKILDTVSSFGCDSTVELRVTVIRLFDDSISVCSNDLPYEWHNKKIYESGIYRDTIVSEGTQTVIGLKVNVLPIVKASEPEVVAICEGDFYTFGGKKLNEQGTYYDTLTAVNGCDSIIMLALQVKPSKYQTMTKRIFEGDTVFFYGDTLTTSGIYEHRELNADKCTDTYQLVLTVLKTFNVDTTATICQNDLPFMWRGIEYNETGDYTMPISWNDSSRVVKTLHLTVNPTFYYERNISLCSGDKFNFKDRTYTESCEFFDTIPSLVGCDSIVKYVISVHPTYDKIIEKHISDKEPYIFHGRVLTISGNYEWTGKSVNGCDSMEHLLLHVHPSYFKSDTVDLCQSDTLNYPYLWKDENDSLILKISQSGTYTDSILTQYGFDSVRQVVVYIHPAYMINEQYEIGEGEILKIHGRDISSPAVYYDTMRTIYGCDSIYHIVVNKKRTREFTWTKSICQGETFDFFGRTLTKTGQYKYTSQYKDSTVTLTLTVNPVTYSEKRIVITDKATSYIGKDGQTYYSYIHEGMMYDSLRSGSNLFTEQYVNQYGCDSIARLIIVVSTHYSEWTPMALCPGSEIKIDGDTIREAGLYTFLRRSKVTGEMDSIYRVEVYDAPAYEFDDTLSLCDGDTVFYGNIPITRGGKQDIKLKTKEGCDSVYHLNVTVYPSYRFYTDATIADYERYTWRDKSYNETGEYNRTWPTLADPDHTCDSTYTLRLTVIPTQRYISEDTICDGQEFVWRGDTIRKEGYYTDTVYRPETFFSAIYTLKLIVLRPTNITSATAKDACADDTELEISFSYSGAKPTTYSIYFNQAAKDEGFVDVVNKPLNGEDKVVHAPIPQKDGVLYNGHPNYVRPDRYPIRLVFGNGSCGKSTKDSIMMLVKYPSWIIEQNWDDVVAPLKKAYNGDFEFTRTNWYVNGVLQPNNGLGYLHNDRLQPGDLVYMTATRKGDNYTIPTCPIEIQAMPATVDNDPIIVRPKVAPHYAPRITIEAQQVGEYAIYSSMGTFISSGKLEEGIQQVVLPTTSGIYFIRTTQDKEETTHKIVLY